MTEDARSAAHGHEPGVLSDRNPASVVGVPWNEDGYAGDQPLDESPAARNRGTEPLGSSADYLALLRGEITPDEYVNDGQEKVGMHDLRHSFIANALAAGCTLPEAATLGRHADARVTAIVYAGITDQARSAIAGKLIEAGIGT